jgi:LacI family transcriptional regulator
MIEPLGEYVQGLLRGVVNYSINHKNWIFYRGPGKHEGILPQIELSDADGIIARIPNTPKAKQKLPSNIPVIAVGYRKEIRKLPQILGCSQEIGEMAADYFIQKGFKNFAFCGFDEMHWSRERAEKFQETIEQKGFQVSIYKNLKKSKRKLWYLEQQDLAKWLNTLKKPTALLACNDDRGQHILSACKLARLSVPDDIAILGVDNDNFVCGLSSPPLSSIALGAEKAGYETAKILDDMMAKKTTESRSVIVHPTHVVTRQSTDILAIEDERLADAMKFIHKNSESAISVDDVSKAAFTPRRTLERLFNNQLNRTINEEIRHTRVNNIIKMLLETDLSINQIGLALGYRDLTHIARYFKEETGITPLAYRNNFRKT